MASDTHKKFSLQLRTVESKNPTVIKYHSLIDRIIFDKEFYYTTLDQCVFESCLFEDVDFRNTIVRFSTFRRCTFCNCRMSGITCHKVEEEASTYIDCEGSLTND